MNKPVILTGLRANNQLHLGNYLGAIQPMINLQSTHAGEYQLNMFIPDLHSFTTPIDHKQLYRQVIDSLKIFVAAGLDINNPDTFIYRQSYIPAHSELTWILDCFTYFGEASRMIEFKDKSTKAGSDTVSVGLFNYPVLMAADILLYDAKFVPVGEDQKQHLELVRNLATRFNSKFDKDIFTLPEPWDKLMEFSNRDSGLRIRSLRHPDSKMSKSVEDPAGTIMLNDDPELAAKKVMNAETDSIGSIHLDWEKQPGISNLLQILASLSNRSLAKVAAEWEGKSSYGELKKQVAEQVIHFLQNLQSKLSTINVGEIIKKLESDEAAMTKVANAKLLEAQKAVGLRE